MLVQFPTGVLISNVVVTHNIPTFATESISLKKKTKGRGLHRMEGEADITVGNSIREQKGWTSFIISAEGRLNEYELDLPLQFKSDTVTSNPKVSSQVDIGSTVLPLSAFSGEVYAGSCFTIPNDTKVYYTKENVVSGGSVTVFPAIRTTILSGGTIEFINPVITARFKEDNQTINYDESGFILTAQLSWEEVL